jgi:flagellar basal-body rod protein FlgB
MDDLRLFDKTLQTVVRALDLRARRHELIISNIANADTPGYKSFDLMVEAAMSRQAKANAPLGMQRTDERHLTVSSPLPADIRPYVVQNQVPDYLRGDGNSVDMEREMTRMSANQVLYKVSAQIAAKRFQSLKNVIQGGKS